MDYMLDDLKRDRLDNIADLVNDHYLDEYKEKLLRDNQIKIAGEFYCISDFEEDEESLLDFLINHYEEL